MASTFTLTGTLYHQDNVTPVANTGLKIKAAPYPDPALSILYTRGISFVTDANGHFSQTLVTESGLYYTIRSTAKVPMFAPITFAAGSAGATLDLSTLTSYDPTGMVPNVYTDTIAARNAAQAAAAGVQTNNWAASTAYATGQIVRAPDGSTIRRNSAGTSRASFDATEQANWTAVIATTGTMERNAVALTITQPYVDAPSGGDDLTMLQAAFNSPGANGGRIPLRPNATYLASNTVEVPNKVTARGAGRSSTTIKAHSSFPTTGAPLVRLGPASGLSFASRLEDMTVDCNSVAGTTGVYSYQGQEMVGLERVTVSGFKVNGINFDTGAANFTVRDCEVYPASTGATNGILMNASGSQIIEKVTVGVSGALTVGISATNGELTAIGCHIENCTDGILIDGGRGVIIGASGPTSTANVTNLIRGTGNTRYFVVINATKGAATNIYKSDFFGITVTDSFVQSAIMGNQQVARFQHNGDQVGFYNTTPIARQTRAGQLTDSTGGAVNATLSAQGTTYSQAGINQAIASLAAKINALETVLHNLGLTT